MHKIFSFFSIIVICASTLTMNAQQNPIAILTINAGNHDYYDTPVGVIVEELMNISDIDNLLLVEVSGNKRIPVMCQVEQGITRKIWWIMDGYTQAGTTRNYEIFCEKELVKGGRFEVVQDSSVFRIFKLRKEVLNYHYTIYPAPEGADDFYSRSGFIHPLYSPNGNILTRIQPPDHLHHYGIWNPWTKVKFQNREVDFWNLGKGQGTVRYAGTNAQFGGAIFGGFRVRQEHVDLTSGKEITAINEIWDVRVWNTNVGNNEVFLIDITDSLSCAGNDTVFLEQYRYGGGIGFRATQYWNKENCRVETSTGESRKTADATKASWCNVSGQMPDGDRSGILFISHPENKNHPEPMRVWPEDANNGRGDMFFEFCPIRDKDWILIPGKKYVLKYRLLVYDGEITTQLAEDLWTGFAYPPNVEISYNKIAD
ncbi:MAG: PmoA family protein [Bacteroidetes bacterium]|nr:PmoA family protein [Bacteroidota bacterium]